MSNNEHDPLTVTDLTATITQACQHLTPQPLWVTGTLTSWKRSTKWGRGELALYEPNSTNVTAKIALGCPAKTAIGIERGFAQNGKTLTTGTNIVILGQLDFHPVYGLRLHVTTIRPDLIDDSQRHKDRLTYLTELQHSGRLNRQRQLTLPPTIQTIGLITPEGGDAGRQDALEILRPLPINITELRVPTAGPNAPTAIKRALGRLETQTQLIVCVRGGGAASDLSVWDDPLVVDAIALTLIPVITGVGHATNNTLAKAAAHHGAATPTAAATWVSQLLTPQPAPPTVEQITQPAAVPPVNRVVVAVLAVLVLALAAVIAYLMTTN